MTALPNAPITKAQGEDDQSYLQKLASIGWFNPPIVRYFDYWGTFFGGTFGVVYNNEGTPLTTYFFQNIPNTIYIAALAYILAIFLGFLFGLISGVYRGKWQDTFINVISVILISVPSFIIGILLLRLAGVIGLPQNFVNFDDPNFTSLTFVGSSIMPILCLTFGLASTLTYYVRNELVEVLSQDYIKTALSKGLSKWKVIFKHAVRNSLIPALSVLGPSFLSVFTGSIIIEQIFGVNGIANIMFNSILQNNFNLVMFQVFFISGLYFLINLFLDISFTFIDPRIKLANASQASVYRIIKAKLDRATWRKHWNDARHNGANNYFLLNNTESLFHTLSEIKAINYSKKTVTLTQDIFALYKINAEVKYFVIGKDVYKIKLSNLNSNTQSMSGVGKGGV
ncbi:MAG: ABC transporter permease [Malacoplasma sp.]|nr:ABC transporter permease [Malacoplasma sp.]